MFSPAVIHLPASWDTLIIVKEIVLTGFTASDGIIYTATSEDVFDLISLLEIEGNITKDNRRQTDQPACGEGRFKELEIPSLVLPGEDNSQEDWVPPQWELVKSEESGTRVNKAELDLTLCEKDITDNSEESNIKDQPCLVPPAKRTRRSTLPATATVPDER